MNPTGTKPENRGKPKTVEARKRKAPPSFSAKKRLSRSFLVDWFWRGWDLWGVEGKFWGSEMKRFCVQIWDSFLLTKRNVKQLVFKNLCRTFIKVIFLIQSLVAYLK